LLLYSSHLPLGVSNGLVIHHATSNNLLAPLPGSEEEEVPTSTTLSHVNLAPAASFLAPLPGSEEEEVPTSTTLSHVNLAPAKTHP
jgi:hypothetical protein